MPRALAVLLPLLFACTNKPAEPELQLRSYQVPAGSAERMRGVLSNALYLEKDKSVGRVSVANDGQLVVLGAPAVQAGVAEAIKLMGNAPPPASVELTYWMVRAKRSSGAKAPLPAELAPVKDALAALDEQGASFELAERLRLTSLADERAQVQGNVLEVTQVASVVGDKVVADLRIFPRAKGTNRVEARAQLKPGETVVLAEAGTPEGEGETLYIVRAKIAGK